jgi:hypothetical protein
MLYAWYRNSSCAIELRTCGRRCARAQPMAAAGCRYCWPSTYSSMKPSAGRVADAPLDAAPPLPPEETPSKA